MQEKQKQISEVGPIFDMLFPIEGLSPVSHTGARHMLCNAMAHYKGTMQHDGYLSSVQAVPLTGKYRGCRSIRVDVIRTYTPSTFEGEILPFDCKVSA